MVHFNIVLVRVLPVIAHYLTDISKTHGLIEKLATV